MCVICLIESPFKNAFYLTLKNIFVLKIFKFLSRFFGHVGKATWLERLTSKLMTSQPGLQTIAMHILPNISQSKGNQTIKFGQLIEFNKSNDFLQKLYSKWDKELVSDLFLFFKNAQNEANASGLQRSFSTFW